MVMVLQGYKDEFKFEFLPSLCLQFSRDLRRYTKCYSSIGSPTHILFIAFFMCTALGMVHDTKMRMVLVSRSTQFSDGVKICIHMSILQGGMWMLHQENLGRGL